MTRCLTIVVLSMLLLGVMDSARSQVPDPSAGDEKIVQAANLKTDSDSLLDFFRRRTLLDAKRDEYRALVKQLGSEVFRLREQAMNELVKGGIPVVEILREALKNADLEMTRRADRCIQRILESDVGPDVAAAAVRLLSRQRPAAAVETMLAYLPFADSELVADEARNLLAKFAVVEGKSHPVLLAALEDKTALRRGAAGEAFAKGGGPEQRLEAKKLLADKEPSVRLRVSVALAYAKERDAVPPLIDVLAQVPLQDAWRAEDVLYRLAEGLEPPKVSLGTDATGRARCRDAWHAWWKEHGAKVDLTKLHESQRLLGYTVIVLLDVGRVLEVTNDKQVRWQVNDLRFPLDVQPLPGDRLLVAEYHGNRVTERDVKTGEVKWQKEITGPLVAQRLPNGNTFVATDTELIEFDRADKEALHITRTTGERIMKAMKLLNGEIACLTSDMRILRLDAAGKELSGFQVSLGTRLYGGRIHMLPDGRVLVPHNSENKVVEYDSKGKQVWEVNVEQPVAATRLPNGNTLVTTMLPQRGAVEFDPQGQEIWSYRSTTRVTRAVRR